MQKLHNADPVELALLVALAVTTAIAVLVAALLALLLAMAGWSPAAPVNAINPLPPAQHPLASLADATAADLNALNMAQLRTKARAAKLPGSLVRSGRKAALINALVSLDLACS